MKILMIAPNGEIFHRDDKRQKKDFSDRDEIIRRVVGSSKALYVNKF